jgi:hypothetical protein
VHQATVERDDRQGVGTIIAYHTPSRVPSIADICARRGYSLLARSPMGLPAAGQERAVIGMNTLGIAHRRIVSLRNLSRVLVRNRNLTSIEESTNSRLRRIVSLRNLSRVIIRIGNLTRIEESTNSLSEKV